MSFVFPTSPGVGLTFSVTNRTWKWNGKGWELDGALVGPGGSGLTFRLPVSFAFASIPTTSFQHFP